MASLARDNPLRRAARKIQAVSAFQDALRRRVAGHAGAEAAPPPALELNATTSASAPIRTSTTAEAVVGTYDEVFDFFADLPIRTTAPDDLPRVARGDLPSKRDNVCRAMVERGYIVVSLSDEDAELVAKARAMEDVGFSFQRLLYRLGIHPCIHTHVHTCTCTLGPKLSLNPQAMEKTSAQLHVRHSPVHPASHPSSHHPSPPRASWPLRLFASSQAFFGSSEDVKKTVALRGDLMGWYGGGDESFQFRACVDGDFPWPPLEGFRETFMAYDEEIRDGERT